jgi:CubicO group peptidase (beta-lactamase class C family)
MHTRMEAEKAYLPVETGARVPQGHRRFGENAWLRRIGRCAFIVYLLVSAMESVLNAQQDEPAVPTTLQDLHQRIRNVLDETGTPGMIGGLVSRDGVLWTGGVGVADRATGRAADATTMFRVGSISKSFISLAVLILQERGLLSLEAPIADLVPEAGVVNAWTPAEPVRIKHLLEHTAGFDDIHPRDLAHSDPATTLLQGIQFNTTSRIVRWKPGTRMSYSNLAPSVAALAVEKASGERFEDFVAREIFKPLRMNGATFFYDQRIAKSYNSRGEEIPFRHIIARPSGAVSVTATDMANFVRMFIGRGELDGRRIVQPVSIDRMETPSTGWAAQAGVALGFGPGMVVSERNGFRFYGHDGGIDGFRSIYGYLRSDGLGYFFSINSGTSLAYARIDALLRGYLTRGVEPRPKQLIMLSASELRSYEGYYEPETPRTELFRFLDRIRGIVTVKVDGDALALSRLGAQQLRLIPVAPDQFRQEEDSGATTIFVQNGNHSYLQRLNAGTFRRIPAWVAWSRWVTTASAFLVMVSAILFAVVWVPRLALGRVNGDRICAARVAPLLPVVCLLSGIIMLFGAGPEVLGAFTLRSVGFTALTWLFAITTLLGAWAVWKVRETGVHRGVWRHAALVTTANLLALVYLGCWGILGIRLWAY